MIKSEPVAFFAGIVAVTTWALSTYTAMPPEVIAAAAGGISSLARWFVSPARSTPSA